MAQPTTKSSGNLGKLVFIPVMTLVAIWSFVVPDAKGFMFPSEARIFFWHFPCSILLLACMFTGIYFSFRVFRRYEGGFKEVTTTAERLQWDARAASVMELGFVWACLTMATGIIFSLSQWGALWQWDPRQTSFLLALLLYAAYFALRNAFADVDKRAQFTAVYVLASALPIFFLVLVFPRLPQVKMVSFHPSDTIMGGQLKGQYLYVTLTMLALMSYLSVWLYKLHVRSGLLALELDESHGTPENSGRSTGRSAVVRPVVLPGEGGSSSQGD